MKALLALSWLAALADAATLNVGSGKTYTTVSLSRLGYLRNSCTDSEKIAAAYAAAAAGDTIYVYPGTYNEKLTISKASITIKGSTYPSLNPSGNTALITYSTYASAAGSNDASGTQLDYCHLVHTNSPSQPLS
jgi:pectinesterase